MASRALYLLAFVLLSKADRPLPSPTGAPRLDAKGLSAARMTLTDIILSNPVINIVSDGSPTVRLDNVSLRVDNIALVHLANLQLRSSPLQLTSAVPDLRLESMNLHGSITMLEVVGNYCISVEIMNHTSMALITSDKGSLNLTFQNVDISGSVGLNLKENRLEFHTADLLYRPNKVALRIYYKDGEGFPRVTEENSSSVHGSVEEPIYIDVAKRLNRVIREELNSMLKNITMAQLMGNSSGTETSLQSGANSQIGDLNEFIDYILNITKNNMRGQISIPDFESTFEKKLGLIAIRGNFKAEDGWVEGLQTIRRTANVTLQRVNDTLEVSAALGFKRLEFGYARYRAKLLNVGPSGTLTASVGKSSMNFRGTVDYTDNRCTATSIELKVTNLQDMNLKLTGLSPFNWILSKIATSVTSRSKFNIARAIEETVGNQISNNLKLFDCRQYFPESTVRAAEPDTEQSESGQNEL